MPSGPRPFIPADRCARLELIYSQNEQVCENVVYLQGDHNFDADNLTSLVTEAIVAWDATLGTVANENTMLTLVRATAINEFPAAQIEAPSTATGALLGAGVPGNVTVATKFSGGLTGRSTRGRAYFVGLDAGQLDGNQLAGTTNDDIADAWHDFFAAINAVASAHPIHVIVSYSTDGAWREEAIVTPVLNYSTEKNLDSQRRRLTGRGL